MPGPTQVLARFARDVRFGDLPPRTVREAHRTFLNWLGCAIGASRHAALENALKAIRAIQGPAQAAILGRRERTDIADRKSTRLNSSHIQKSRMPSSA